MLAFVDDEGAVLRADVLGRFHLDDELVVRSVLRDLVEERLIYKTGRGDGTTFAKTDLRTMKRRDLAPTLDSWVQVAVSANGPIDRAGLAELVPTDDPRRLDAALARLSECGDVAVGADGTCSSRECLIGYGDEAGWEAAVFDHYQSVVAAIVTKLRNGKRRADLGDKIGGAPAFRTGDRVLKTGTTAHCSGRSRSRRTR